MLSALTQHEHFANFDLSKKNALSATLGVHRGRIDMQVRNGDLICWYVSFISKFSGDGTPIRIFAPINHGNKLSGIRELAFIWIEACIVQSGKNLEGKSIMIDWFAFQGSQSGVSHGQAIFSLTTIGSHCNRVKFTQAWIIKA